MLRSTWFPTLVASLSLAACAHGHANTAAPASYAGPVAPAQWTSLCEGAAELARGTRIPVQMNDSLRFATAFPGEHFTAAVVTPIRARTGCVIVPSGALVRGTIVAVDVGAAPTIHVVFDRMDTAFGVARIRATVPNAQTLGAAFIEPPAAVEVGSSDAVVRSRAIGGGPGDGAASAPLLPVNTPLELVLTYPVRLGDSI